MTPWQKRTNALTQRMAEDMLGHLSPRKALVAERATFTGGQTIREKNLEQAHFAMAFESPGYMDDAIYTAQIWSTAFGGGMSSRLFQEVREKRGLCYTIFAQTGAYADTGMTTIYAGTSEADIRSLAEVTAAELARAGC